MADAKALDLDMRRRIVGLVREYAGLHLREVARQLDTSVALVEYHVPVLVDAGLIHAERSEGYQRLFPSGPTHPQPSTGDRARLSVLRGPVALHIVLRLLDAGAPQRHKDLADALEIGKSTLSFHLGKLLGVEVVEKDDDGAFRLKDPKATARLLIDHKPTRDLREAFADLWLSFYGG